MDAATAELRTVREKGQQVELVKLTCWEARTTREGQTPRTVHISARALLDSREDREKDQLRGLNGGRRRLA